MKMTKSDYSALKTAVEATVKIHGAEKIKAHRELLNADDRVKDLDMRYRWDILSMSFSGPLRRDFFDRAYSYLTDAHIDTALKSIVKELEL